MSTIRRETRETQVAVTLRLAADSPEIQVATGQAFLDHMVTTLARYAGLDLTLEATGDLRHHLIEDVAITFGLALREEIPDTCTRYGSATVVMDDALVSAALDAGGRPYYEGPVPSGLYDHFFRSLADNAGLTLHIEVRRGRDRHHVVEAAVKAVALALRTALAPGSTVFSTKGSVLVRREEA